MGLAKASEFQDDRRLRRPALVAVIACGVMAAAIPARSECQSPSAASGATTTTVYRCPDEDATGMQSPIVVDPGKTTEVERGSADDPWFEPKPTKTTDPIQTSNTPLDKKEDAAEAPPASVQPASPAAAKAETNPPDAPAVTGGKAARTETTAATKEEPVPADAQGTTDDEPAQATEKAEASPADPPAAEVTKKKAVKPKQVEKEKTVKAKPAKKKLAKVKRSKAKLANKTKLAKAKPAKATPVEAKAAPDPAKTEPAKDDKVVVWTKKDMGLGSRVKNWLGF
jgi:hypothetical protein